MATYDEGLDVVRTMQKEGIFFFILFLFLAIGMHFDAWMHYPIKHIHNLDSSSLGIWHPLFMTFIIYLLIGIGRSVILLWKKLKNKGKNR